MRDSFRWVGVLCVALALFAPVRLPAAQLQIGSDVSGAPFEFFPANSKVPLGFDIDLLHAIAAKMGDQADVVNHQFDDLLASVRRGRFNAAMSAISDTSAREKQVDFLDYFVAGGGIMVTKGNPLRVYGIDALCGYAVTVESGTSYQNDLEKQSKSCQAVGLNAITIYTYATDDEAFAAFSAGKAPTYVADYPVSEYRAYVANAGKGYEVVGRQFDVVPYGIAFSKQDGTLLRSMQQALLSVVADGTYDKLLKKWGLKQGGLRFAPVNAGILYEK